MRVFPFARERPNIKRAI